VEENHGRSLFLFRRDLRVHDNSGLIKASSTSETVISAFIFDPRLASQNPYFSHNAFQFMVESLSDLSRQVAAERGFLSVFRGRPEAIVERLIAEKDVEAVFVNRDYTPFSRARDTAIAKVRDERHTSFHCCSDLLLHEPGDFLKDDGKPYTIFSHFLKKARSIPIRPVNTARVNNLSNLSFALESREPFHRELPDQNALRSVRGGRPQSLKMLSNLHKCKEYETEREYPAKSGTTRLSAHNNFVTDTDYRHPRPTVNHHLFNACRCCQPQVTG